MRGPHRSAPRRPSLVRPLRAEIVALAALLLAACGSADDEPSLRDSLDALPHDTSSAGVPPPVTVDTMGVQVDTLGAPAAGGAADSSSAPWQPPPSAPNDVRPWVPERGRELSDAGPGEWTGGSVARASGASRVAVQTAIRTARHPEFDRVVLEMAGEELPGYHVEYVDRPARQCGSGEAVRVAGEGWLRVRLEPARAHDDDGRATLDGASRAFRPTLSNVLEVRMTCDFEGQVEWVVGLRSPGRYRVLELSSPARVVIDVAS